MEDMLGITTIEVFEDLSKIKKVHFNNPELLAIDAEELVKKEFYEIQRLEEELSIEREKVRNTEDLLKEKKDSFQKKSALFTLEFETYEKKVTNYKSYVFFKGVGNDIIGKKNS